MQTDTLRIDRQGCQNRFNRFSDISQRREINKLNFLDGFPVFMSQRRVLFKGFIGVPATNKLFFIDTLDQKWNNTLGLLSCVVDLIMTILRIERIWADHQYKIIGTLNAMIDFVIPLCRVVDPTSIDPDGPFMHIKRINQLLYEVSISV